MRWLCALAALVGVQLSPVAWASSAETARPAVVAYLVSGSADSSAVIPSEFAPSDRLAPHTWQWRTFDPSTGRDTVIFTLPSFPTHVRWDPGFDSVEFVVADRIMRAAWRLGARPLEQVRLPMDSALCGFWRDTAEHRWHVVTQEERQIPIGDDRVQITQIATRWDLDGSGRWRPAVVDTGGDENGACFGSERLHLGAPPAAAVTVSALLDSMRIGWHRSLTAGRSQDDEASDRIAFVPSAADSSVGVEVRVGFGDSEHAMAPVVWVDRSRGARRTVYAPGDSLNDALGQVAFSERRGLLLMTSEYSGAFPAVVDLRSGAVVFRVSRPSARAVWVPAPR